MYSKRSQARANVIIFCLLLNSFDLCEGGSIASAASIAQHSNSSSHAAPARSSTPARSVARTPARPTSQARRAVQQRPVAKPQPKNVQRRQPVTPVKQPNPNPAPHPPPANLGNGGVPPRPVPGHILRSPASIHVTLLQSSQTASQSGITYERQAQALQRSQVAQRQQLHQQALVQYKSTLASLVEARGLRPAAFTPEADVPLAKGYLDVARELALVGNDRDAKEHIGKAKTILLSSAGAPMPKKWHGKPLIF